MSQLLSRRVKIGADSKVMAVSLYNLESKKLYSVDL
jgi:hypothetical protein